MENNITQTFLLTVTSISEGVQFWWGTASIQNIDISLSEYQQYLVPELVVSLINVALS